MDKTSYNGVSFKVHIENGKIKIEIFSGRALLLNVENLEPADAKELADKLTEASVIAKFQRNQNGQKEI